MSSMPQEAHDRTLFLFLEAPRAIPSETPPDQLRVLQRRYTNPCDPETGTLPELYRRRLIARVNALIAVGNKRALS